MNILIVDAQGGGVGRQLVLAICARFPDADITAVGTNAAATSAMMKAGASRAATGENAVVVCSRRADVIVGAIGIVIADAMLGEITPRMAAAVAQSGAKRRGEIRQRCYRVKSRLRRGEIRAPRV